MSEPKMGKIRLGGAEFQTPGLDVPNGGGTSFPLTTSGSATGGTGETTEYAYDAGFRAGAEAMRAAAAKALEERENIDEIHADYSALYRSCAEAIRAMTLPEPPK